WRYIAGISGAVSVISWTTITFIDFFPNMTLSYFQLLAGYVSAVCISMTVNLALAWFDQRRIAFPLIGLSHTKEHGKI
ncbi:MAG: hypothetical protein Q8P39_02235, partial [Candidatus Yanofskybacteria bacterium]|nr:hypothetical protein [Candidatus Yanofskybacteria bacterium]